MEDTPLVSIVLPTYNGSRYLAEAIESCLAQTYPHWELLIVDDASTDDTPAVIARYAARDARIRSFRHETNRRLPAALNTGFAHARGAYLTWTSDDNRYADTALETMVTALQSSDADFVYADYFLLDESGGMERYETPAVFDPATGETVGACFLYTRAVKEEVGDYDEQCFLVEDYDYWLRVSRRFCMRHIPEPLYYYRFHAGSLTAEYSRSLAILTASILIRLKHGAIDLPRAVALGMQSVFRNTYPPGKRSRMGFALMRLLLLGMVNPYRMLNDARERYRKYRLSRVMRQFVAGRIGFVEAREEVAAALRSPLRQLTWEGRSR